MRKFLTVLACVGLFITITMAEGELKTKLDPQVFYNTDIYKSDIHKKSGITIEELDYILINTSLNGYAHVFKKMEDTYDVNAVFAISVASIEGGIMSKRVDNKNNYFGLVASGIKIRYKSIEDNIRAFFKLMKKECFIKKNFKNFSAVYCPSNHKSWREAIYSKYYYFMTLLNEYNNSKVLETSHMKNEFDYSEIMINFKLESSELA